MTQTVFLPDAVARVQVFWASADDAYFSPETIIAVTELTNNTLTNWRSQGRGPEFVRQGKLVYYKKAAVVKWLKAFQPSITPAD